MAALSSSRNGVPQPKVRFWDMRIDDTGWEDLVLNHYVRIKIFTERGRDLNSKIDIPFIKGVKIKDVAARTIKPDGTIVELAWRN